MVPTIVYRTIPYTGCADRCLTLNEGDDIVSTSRENLEQFKRVMSNEHNRRFRITLPAYTIDEGMHFFKDFEKAKSMIYTYLADLDISSTYPNAEDCLNISKETTAYETCKFEGFTEAEQRYFSLTLTTGRSSALELAIRYLGMPSPNQLLDEFDKDFPLGIDSVQVTTKPQVELT